MGPQLYRCGNSSPAHPSSHEIVTLQWGRNFIVAETCIPLTIICEYPFASMGPQLYRCGNTAHCTGYSSGFDASMGPQLYRCGNQDNAIRRINLHCASMGPQLYRCGNPDETLTATIDYRVLQWGRNFIVAETKVSASKYVDKSTCFNGAATLSLRKHGIRDLGYNIRTAASMGPQLYRCGNCPIQRQSPYIRSSFNGAATLSLRKPDPVQEPDSRNVQLQWGRNFIVAETTEPARSPPWYGSFNGAATLSLRKLPEGPPHRACP